MYCNLIVEINLMLLEKNFIDELINDPTIGAGNFIYKLYQKKIQNERALIYLDQPFLDHRNDLIFELSIDYIVDVANRYAAYYYKIGIMPRDPVVLFFDEGINYFLQFVAITSIGAIPIFMNGSLDNELVVLLTECAHTKFFITSSERAKRIRPILYDKKYSLHLIELDQVSLSEIKLRPDFYNYHDDDTVLLVHTSGTTGIPKIVQFTHGSMFFGIRSQLKKQPGHRILSLLPHSHGSSVTILMSTLLRLTTIKIQTQKEPKQVLKTVEDYQPDLVVAFPKMFVDLCRHEQQFKDYNLSSIQYWLSTGDANHEPHIRALIAQGYHIDNGIKKPGSVFIDNLGSSEFSFAMFRNIHTSTSNNYDRCIGTPFKWMDSAVLSESGSILPPYTVGFLGVRSCSVTKGYWNNSLLTEKNRLLGYWLTGDLVYRDENEVYYHVDRVSDKIETAQGVLYSCQAEEWILKNLECIFDLSFVEFNNINNQKNIAALVELRQNATNTDLDWLKNEINNLLTIRSWPNINKIKIQSSHEDTGITGKKLKVKIRKEYNYE